MSKNCWDTRYCDPKMDFLIQNLQGHPVVHFLGANNCNWNSIFPRLSKFSFPAKLFSRLFSFPVLFRVCSLFGVHNNQERKSFNGELKSTLTFTKNTFRSCTKNQNKMGIRYTIDGFRIKTAKLDQHRSYIFVVFIITSKVKSSIPNGKRIEIQERSER